MLMKGLEMAPDPLGFARYVPAGMADESCRAVFCHALGETTAAAPHAEFCSVPSAIPSARMVRAAVEFPSTLSLGVECLVMVPSFGVSARCKGDMLAAGGRRRTAG
jgi:hypothetical protein